MKKSEESPYIIRGLFKFGNAANITDLFENGTIYLNTIQYFRTVEDAELRGDKYEGAIEVLNFPAGDFEIPVLNFKGKYISLHARKVFEEALGNIYSLYCISSFATPNPRDFIIDKRIKNFGTHCLMIENIEEFLYRIETALKKRNFKYNHGFVSYYDRFIINGPINLFQKPKEFEYQNEFRFYVQSDIIEPIILNIGSLVDIAQIIPTENFLSLKLISNSQTLSN